MQMYAMDVPFDDDTSDRTINAEGKRPNKNKTRGVTHSMKTIFIRINLNCSFFTFIYNELFIIFFNFSLR